MFPADAALLRGQSKEADNMWKMLDDLQANDPEAYKEFVKKSMAEGADEFLSKGGKKKLRNYIVPTPRWVIKGRKLDRGNPNPPKLFVNITSHEGLQMPLDAGGREVKEGMPGAAAKQIPLLVGKPRTIELKSSCNTAVAIDVVFNPWVIDVAEHDNIFKSYVADLALNWVVKDNGATFLLRPGWKFIRSLYKGGQGEQGTEPVRFDISDELESTDNSCDGKEDCKKENCGNVADDSSSLTTINPSSSLNDPSELLKCLRSKKTKDESSDIISSSSKVTKKPLIQMLDEKGNVEKERPKKKKPAVRKGFLRKKTLDLYGEEGSNEGNPPPDPYPFAKTIDTRGMSNKDLQKAMEEHAAGPGYVNKATLSSGKKEKEKKVKQKKNDNRVKESPDEAALLDRLLAAADDDFATAPVEDARKESEEMMKEMSKAFEHLGGFSNLCEPSPSSSTSDNNNELPSWLGGPTPKPHPYNETENDLKGTKKNELEEEPVLVDSQADSKKKSLQYTMEDKGDKLIVKVECPDVIDMKQINVDIRGKKVIVSSSVGHSEGTLELQLPRVVNPDYCSAKFKKKRKLLKLTLQ
eukprot:g3128.t1